MNKYILLLLLSTGLVQASVSPNENILLCSQNTIPSSSPERFETPQESYALSFSMANKGCPKSQYTTGIAYFNGIGIPKNQEEALKWFTLSAVAGYPDAQYVVALYCDNLKDFQNAFLWYKAAAENGHRSAMYNLAICYESGEGVSKNYAEAFKWFASSANQGDKDSQFCLGYCYALGRGVSKNYEEALKWYAAAADQGHKDAQDRFLALNAALTMADYF